MTSFASIYFVIALFIIFMPMMMCNYAEEFQHDTKVEFCADDIHEVKDKIMAKLGEKLHDALELADLKLSSGDKYLVQNEGVSAGDTDAKQAKAPGPNPSINHGESIYADAEQEPIRDDLEEIPLGDVSEMIGGDKNNAIAQTGQAFNSKHENYHSN